MRVTIWIHLRNGSAYIYGDGSTYIYGDGSTYIYGDGRAPLGRPAVAVPEPALSPDASYTEPGTERKGSATS